jgi:hypothetical protein
MEAPMLAPDTITYDAEIIAQYLRVGNPIYHERVYVTVTAMIRDEARRRVIVETRGNDDEVTRVFEITYDTGVEAGVVTQYGIDRPEQRYVMPVHTGHGTRARGMALGYIARRGGALMRRPVIPDTTSETGARALDEFQPAP